jgi:hypothetical protein
MRESGLLVSYEQTYQYVIPQMAISVDAVNVCPSYRRPFDMIIKRAQKGRMVGAEGFEPPTLCSQRMATWFVLVCT